MTWALDARVSADRHLLGNRADGVCHAETPAVPLDQHRIGDAADEPAAVVGVAEGGPGPSSPCGCIQMCGEWECVQLWMANANRFVLL